MSDEQINISIAEACGWKSIGRAWVKRVIIQDAWESPSGEIRTLRNYCNDLNAMHEAVKTLQQNLKPRYFSCLCTVVSGAISLNGYSAAIEATSRQRAEAFLKTIGKWEDAK